MDKMIKREDLTRQADLIPLHRVEALKVLVIGCGAIGSFATLALAKMGVGDITAYDFDTVDTVNMNNQFYRFKDIGKAKATALHELVEDFTGVKITSHVQRFEGSNTMYDIVVMAVDSMEARKDLHTKVKTKYMIDTRMGAEVYNQYVVNMRSEDSIKSYGKTLYTDGEAVQERCTAKSTIYTALTAGSMVCKAVKNILADEAYPKSILMNLNKSANNVQMFQ